MAAKMIERGLILSSYPYPRSASVWFPLHQEFKTEPIIQKLPLNKNVIIEIPITEMTIPEIKVQTTKVRIYKLQD